LSRPFFGNFLKVIALLCLHWNFERLKAIFGYFFKNELCYRSNILISTVSGVATTPHPNYEIFSSSSMTLFNPSIFWFYFCTKISKRVFRSFSSSNSSKISENTFRNSSKFKTRGKNRNLGGRGKSHVRGLGRENFPN
jgi:hypothetical protein